MMNNMLDEIYEKQIVLDENGNEVKLHSHISIDESRFLQNLIVQNEFENCLEIGCAYGISSLTICVALKSLANKQPNHTIIDPFQSANWSNIGILNLKRAEIDFWKLIEKGSEIALPELLGSNREFDFVFIDGLHTFDQVLLEFSYVNKLLVNNGVIVFDDIKFTAVSSAVRYILKNYPNYEIIYPDEPNRKLKIKTKIKRAFFKKTSLLLSKVLKKSWYFKDSFLNPIPFDDFVFNNKSSMIALRKKDNYSINSGLFNSF